MTERDICDAPVLICRHPEDTWLTCELAVGIELLGRIGPSEVNRKVIPNRVFDSAERKAPGHQLHLFRELIRLHEILHPSVFCSSLCFCDSELSRRLPRRTEVAEKDRPAFRGHFDSVPA